MITLLAAPVTVLLTMLIGGLILTSFACPLHLPEMIAAGTINALGGLLAALPLVFWMTRGADAIVRAWMAGTAIRVGVILFGLFVASGSGWALSKMPLISWTLACYFPLLAVEATTAAWLTHKVRV